MKNKKRIALIVAIVIVVVLIIAGIKFWQIDSAIKKFKAMPAPQYSVTVTKAKATNWQPYIDTTGTLVAVQGVDLTAQASGNVTSIEFRSGQYVKQGDVLLTLENQADLSQLQNAVASMKLAYIDYLRQLDLYKQHATSKSKLDQAAAEYAEDYATVKRFQAQLSYKTITAPFAGRLGIRQVSLGQYIQPGTTITNLQMIDPIFVDYSVPDQDISKVHVGQAIELTVDSYPGQIFKGKITALDPQISADTKSLQVRASLENHDQQHLLLPGMLATVHTLLPEQAGVVTLPQTAIDYTLYGDTVYITAPGKDKNGKAVTVAKQVYVTVGQKRGDTIQIIKGVKAGEQVVTTGQLKLHPNAQIKIVQPPKAEAAK